MPHARGLLGAGVVRPGGATGPRQNLMLVMPMLTEIVVSPVFLTAVFCTAKTA
jgi:hypothetical protein